MLKKLITLTAVASLAALMTRKREGAGQRRGNNRSAQDDSDDHDPRGNDDRAGMGPVVGSTHPMVSNTMSPAWDPHAGLASRSRDDDLLSPGEPHYPR